MIKPCVTGFDIFDARGKKVSHVLAFAEAVELNEQHDPPAPEGPKVENAATYSEKRISDPYSRTWSSTAMSVPIEQIDSFNEAARRAGTSARYVPDKRNPGFAVCECDSKRSRSRELKSRGMFDKEAGYGDYAGR